MPTWGNSSPPPKPKGPQPSRLLMSLLNPKPVKRYRK